MDVTLRSERYVEMLFGRLDRYGLKVRSLQEVVLGVEQLQHKAEVV